MKHHVTRSEFFLRFLAGLVFLAGGGWSLYSGYHQVNSTAEIALYVLGVVSIVIGLAFWGLHDILDDW